jgi:hypothetical protein
VMGVAVRSFDLLASQPDRRRRPQRRPKLSAEVGNSGD